MIILEFLYAEVTPVIVYNEQAGINALRGVSNIGIAAFFFLDGLDVVTVACRMGNFGDVAEAIVKECFIFYGSAEGTGFCRICGSGADGFINNIKYGEVVKVTYCLAAAVFSA